MAKLCASAPSCRANDVSTTLLRIIISKGEAFVLLLWLVVLFQKSLAVVRGRQCHRHAV
jgi:hypothetical protein